MKQIFLIIISLINFLPVYAYDIAFPLDKNITLSDDGIFFVGRTDKKEALWINDTKVKSNKNGSFAESFKLKSGENVFNIKNGENSLVIDKYTVNYIKPVCNESKLVEFPIQDFRTVSDNVILRSTPIDFGMNRLGYLPKNTDLQITGLKNEFSRVYLSPNLSAWVFSKDIIPEQRENTIVGEYRGENVKSDIFSEIHSYKFSKNLPYSAVLDNNLLQIQVFNVENRSNEIFKSQIYLNPPYCYSVKMRDGLLNVSIPNVDMKHPRIIIDAGHGGIEPGAIGCMCDLEKDLNLKAAKAVKKELKSRGYNVSMTRNSDKFVSLKDRVNYTINKNGVVFVSLHMNSIPENKNPNDYRGSETYYYNSFSQPLANCIQKEITTSLGTKDNGVKQASFAVIRPTEYVGVLVETVFLVNPEDTKIYKSKDYYKKVAQGISNGIDSYIKTLH